MNLVAGLTIPMAVALFASQGSVHSDPVAPVALALALAIVPSSNRNGT